MDTPNDDNAANNCSGSGSSSPRKKMQQNSTRGVSLIEDIIFYILIRLPGTFLHRNARFVCKSWAAIISSSQFIEAHVRHAKPGLFLQKITNPCGSCFLELKDNGAFGAAYLYPKYPGMIKNSCDGLVLFMQYGTGVLHVVNPLTKQVKRVPNLPKGRMLHPACAIARVPRTGDFKLFAVIVQEHYARVFVTRWYVLRLGIDHSWRNICTEYGDFDYTYTPVYNNGGYDLYWIAENRVIVMDVDKESFCTFMLPQELQRSTPKYLMMEGCLSSIISLEQGFQIHTFDAQTGIWTFYHQIGHLNYPTSYKVISVSFCGWMNQELIIKLRVLPSFGSLTFGYNVKTRSLRTIIGRVIGSYDLMLHTNSLISC